MSVSNKQTLNVRCPRCRAIAIKFFDESTGRVVARVTCGYCGFNFNLSLFFKNERQLAAEKPCHSPAV